MIACFLLFLFPLVSCLNCPMGNFSSTLGTCLLGLPDSSFYGAEATCIEMGGHLVTIKNGFQNSAILDFARENFCCGVWIGLDQSGFWQDGTPEGYTNYAPGQPAADYRCAQIDQSQNGLWVTLNCTQSTDFICSIPQRNPAKCLDGWTYYPNTNFCYNNMHSSPNVDWNTANARCKAFGAELASIHSRDENHFIQTLAAGGLSRYDLEDNTWIGLQTTQFASGTYTVKWSDGTDTSFINFAAGEPNGEGQENCFLMITNFNYVVPEQLARWFDHFCDVKMNSFICKMKPLQ